MWKQVVSLIYTFDNIRTVSFYGATQTVSRLLISTAKNSSVLFQKFWK